MDIFYLACPACSKEFYADISLLSLDVEFHCPFCGAYFKHKEAKKIDSADQKVSSIVQLSKDKDFYKPR